MSTHPQSPGPAVDRGRRPTARRRRVIAGIVNFMPLGLIAVSLAAWYSTTTPGPGLDGPQGWLLAIGGPVLAFVAGAAIGLRKLRWWLYLLFLVACLGLAAMMERNEQLIPVALGGGVVMVAVLLFAPKARPRELVATKPGNTGPDTGTNPPGGTPAHPPAAWPGAGHPPSQPGAGHPPSQPAGSPPAALPHTSPPTPLPAPGPPTGAPPVTIQLYGGSGGRLFTGVSIGATIVGGWAMVNGFFPDLLGLPIGDARWGLLAAGGLFAAIGVLGLVTRRRVMASAITIGPQELSMHGGALKWTVGWAQVPAVGVMLGVVRRPGYTQPRQVRERRSVHIMLAVQGQEPPSLAKFRSADLPAPFTHDVRFPDPNPLASESRLVPEIARALHGQVPDRLMNLHLQ
ncbi:MAG TPA: hypothetical protein VK095_13340 [Beutenbergiaceae bacterium]|nr:hypothetical protein [Beutenbergiaceae bacterium]